MFDLTKPRPVHFTGSTASAPLTIATVPEFGVIGTLFRGEIRQLRFDVDGALLVLAGRGIRRLDPRTLAETDRWLPDRVILDVLPCGDRLWVLTDAAVFLATFGGELGAPFAAVSWERDHHLVAAGDRMAIPHQRGVTLLDAAAGTARQFLFDEAWSATLRGRARPNRALLSPSGRCVGVALRSGGVVIWDSDTGASLLARVHSEASVLLDDARLLHVSHGSGTLLRFITGESSRVPEDEHFEDAQVRGGKLLVADPEGGFSLYAVDSLAKITTLDFSRNGGRSSTRVCAALSDEHVATYAVTSGVLRVTELDASTVESSDWIGGAEGLSIGQGGRRVGVFREWQNGRLECIDLDAARLIEVRGEDVEITNSAITGDGRKVIVPCGSILRARTVHIGDFGDAASTESHAIKSCVHELVPYRDEAYAISTYTLQGSGHVALHQASSPRALAKLTFGKESPWRIAVGHGCEELLVTWKSATILYDLRARAKPTQTWTFRGGAVALGPRGFLAILEDPDRLHLRTPGTPERVLTLPPREGFEPPRLAFSRDGALLFVGAGDGVLEVRRSDDGTLLRELPVHAGGYVALQGCGEAIWTMGKDGLGFVLGRLG